MAVSGLVVTLSRDQLADAALATLAGDPRLTLGERFDNRIAVVAETPNAHSDQDLFEHLRHTPGITHVDVAFVHLDTVTDAPDERGSQSRLEDQHAHR